MLAKVCVKIVKILRGIFSPTHSTHIPYGGGGIPLGGWDGYNMQLGYTVLYNKNKERERGG